MQEKALKRWESQKESWKGMAKRLAARVGKDETEILHNTSCQWREKGEELDCIAAAVPQEARSSAGWEMSLRSQGDGVRYVRFGTSYPYPLYCPIPSQDKYPAESNALMKVVTEGGGIRKTLAEKSEYYRKREAQYQKHIQRKFPHKKRTDGGMMVIIGHPAPRTTERVDEDVTASIQHYEFIPSPVAGSSHEETPKDIGLPSEPEPPMSSTLAYSEASCPLEAIEHPQGPLLLLTADRLSFTTAPLELAHKPLKAANLGSTAIYYCWKQLPPEELKNSKGVPLPVGPRPFKFILSESHSGVLLPGDEHYFPFSFRAVGPCVGSEVWELQTVPSGKQSITIALRGSCVSKEHDPLSVGFFTDLFNKKTTTDMVSTMLLGVLNAPPSVNPFTQSDLQASLRLTKTASQLQQETAQREAENEQKFLEENDGVALVYSKKLFGNLAAIWGKANGEGAWSGSVSDVHEAVEGVQDAPTKKYLRDALRSALNAATHNPPPGTDIYLYAAVHQMLTSLVNDLPLIAASVEYSLGIAEPPPRPAAGAAAAGGKHQKDAKAAVKPGGKKHPHQPQRGAASDQPETHPTTEAYQSKLTEAVRERLLSGVERALGEHERVAGTMKGL
eukprot:TRINITY_DN20566_c0_g1_i2.p1 TRINITY_DN20566_c0_g1~~TRINITY_DN20566_c0_g1_i2.p1  ORF type:complete len:617 (+),score=74.59 TRINITY_DN20566_c0_g1_i2:50-1900(+)